LTPPSGYEPGTAAVPDAVRHLPGVREDDEFPAIEALSHFPLRSWGPAQRKRSVYPYLEGTLLVKTNDFFEVLQVKSRKDRHHPPSSIGGSHWGVSKGSPTRVWC
jgi:hypothetical protein